MGKKINKNGFTLIEILTAIAIISLITAIGLPFYHNINMNFDLSGESRNLASDLRQAQQLSVTEQINYQLIINQTQNSYSIFNSQNLKKIKERKLKNEITILAVNGLIDNTVEFNATGAANSAGSIVLSNSNLKQATIEIKPSGYVKINN